MSSARVYIDWDRDGSFSDFIDDVTERTRSAAGVSVQYGRDQVTALAPTVSASGSLTLDNRDRALSPHNTDSPLYGYLKPGRPVKVTREVDGTTYTLFYGHTDDQPLNPDLDAQSVAVTLVDHLADFRGQNVTIPLHTGIRTGEAIGYVLDACGWDPAKRDLDDGATIINWFWESNTDAMTALENLVRSEGPPAMLTMSETGSVVFRDRHHRLVRLRSRYSIGTDGLFPADDLYPGAGVFPDAGTAANWRGADGDPEPVMSRPFSYNEGWSTIVNNATVAVHRRRQQDLQAVWTSDDSISLTGGESTVVTATTSDPVTGAVTPVEGLDYTCFGTVTITLLRTAGTSIPIQIETAGYATVIGLQLRASPIGVAYSLDVTARDGASVTDYGARDFPGDLPWCNQWDAQAIIDSAIAQRAQPLPTVSARFVVGGNDDRAKAVLGRDLSDRVTVFEPTTGLDGADFFIESISHDTSGEYDHSVTFGLEAAYVQVADVFRLDTAGQGLDQGHLGTGLDDPDTLLILDDTGAGHVLGQGWLAA